MSFFGRGITWKHPDYQNVVIHSIPLNLNLARDVELPKNLQFISQPEFADVLKVFMPYVNQEKYGQPDPPVRFEYCALCAMCVVCYVHCVLCVLCAMCVVCALSRLCVVCVCALFTIFE